MHLLAIGLAAALIGAPALNEQKNPVPPPIVRNETSTEKFGDWLVEARPSFFGGYTHNESGSTFGILCGKTCVVYKTSDASCVVGKDYGFLVNAAPGAQFFRMRCIVVEESYTYVIGLSDYFVDALKAGGQIGFATPMEDGRFTVSRYSLRGGMEAAGRVADLSKKFEEKDEGALRDFSI